MRFMLIAKANSDSEAGKPPAPALMAAIGQFAQEMTERGKFVGQGGLLPSAAGARVRASGGKLTITDGPFSEAKELVAGYAIVDVPSKHEAVELSRRFLELHMNVYGNSYEGESEVRQMFEMPPQA